MIKSNLILAWMVHALRKNRDTVSIKDEIGGAKACRRTVSMTFMMLGRALELFSRYWLQILRLQAASRYQPNFRQRRISLRLSLRPGGLVP
jgi:hypothetical protein